MGAELGVGVWALVIGSCLVVTGAVVAAGRVLARRDRVLAAVEGGVTGALAVGGWLVLVAVLAGLGVFRARPVGFPFIAPAVALPIVAAILVLRRSERVRRLVAATPQPWLVGIQTLRVLGVVFLVLHAAGRLPGAFAYPAGIGDLLVGVAAPFVAWSLAVRKPWSGQAARVFNVVGLADLVGAVGTGFMAAPSPIRVLFTHPSTELMTVLPLVLIPVFLVPLFAILHVFSLWKLRNAPEGAVEHSSAGRRPARTVPASAGRVR